MKNKIEISSPASDILVFFTLIFAMAAILPLYFHVPHVISPMALDIYKGLGADLNAFTTITNRFYTSSYLLLLPAVLVGSLIVYRGRKATVGLSLIILVMLTLVLCIVWRELMELGLHSMVCELRIVTGAP